MQIYLNYSTKPNIYKENNKSMKFIAKAILENTVIQRPIFHIDEVDNLKDNVMKDLDTQLKVPKEILDGFKLKNDLNSEIWKDQLLKPEVKTKLLKIAKDFFKSLELPQNVNLKDVLFVGSLANYNWSMYSDIDLHLVVDFKEVGENPDQVKKSFDAQKNLWNLKHDITVFDYPVEVYVQDPKEKLHASAVYSIPNDKWVLKPERTKFKLDKGVIKSRVEKMFDKLKQIQKHYDGQNYEQAIEKADALKDEIKKMRKAGLEEGGEFSTENLIFKVLRRTDFMEILDNYKNKAYDKNMSVNEDNP
jgi:hypothetical protein